MPKLKVLTNREMRLQPDVAIARIASISAAASDVASVDLEALVRLALLAQHFAKRCEELHVWIDKHTQNNIVHSKTE